MSGAKPFRHIVRVEGPEDYTILVQGEPRPARQFNAVVYSNNFDSEMTIAFYTMTDSDRFSVATWNVPINPEQTTIDPWGVGRADQWGPQLDEDWVRNYLAPYVEAAG